LSDTIISYQGKLGVVVCCDIGGKRKTYRLLVQKSNRKKPLGQVDKDERMILKYILKK
jgi:hypothetical protein